MLPPFFRRETVLILAGLALFAAISRALPLDAGSADPSPEALRTDSALAGAYTVGGDSADFATPADAVLALITHGVTAPTTLELRAGIYFGALVLTAIPGASTVNNVTFQRASADSGSVTLRSGVTDTTLLLFSGASDITFDGIDLAAGGTALRHVAGLTSGSQRITLRNATLSGPGASILGTDVVWVSGTGSADNHFEDLIVRHAARGFQWDGSTAGSAIGNTLQRCQIDSVRGGVWLTRQKNALVQDNDIVLDVAQSDEADAIRVATTLPGDTVVIDGNRIHGIRTAAVYAVGIRVKTDSTAAVVRISNNMLFDFQTTGSAQVRALYITSGRTEIIGNSILVNDVAATGTTYSLYLGTLSLSGSALLRNNIFVNQEATSLAYNFFTLTSSTPFSSDDNIFHGTGSGYRLGRFGMDQPTLAAWQSATAGDVRSLSGDPGFLSGTDLHLSALNGLAHQNGGLGTGLLTDIDGEARRQPPDRGADEYDYLAPAVDCAVLGFADPYPRYVGATAAPVTVIVFNRGSAPQTDVPLFLYFDDWLVGEYAASLAPLECDTVTMTWNTPDAPATGRLSARCFVAADADLSNDSTSWIVEVVAPPLTGGYAIGTGGDYTTFTAALTDLARRGVTAPVVIDVAPGTYDERVTIPFIPGASAVDTVCFRAASGIVTLRSSLGPATLIFSGARHVHVRGINISAIAPNYVGVLFEAGADSNEIAAASVGGPSLVVSSAYGIHSQGGGCDGNVLRELVIDGFYYGIRLEGASARADCGNLIERCTVTTSRTALRTDFQNAAVIARNTVHAGYPAAATAVYGLWLGTQLSGQQVIADGNQLTAGQGAAGGCAVYSNTGPGNALIANQMVGGWTLTGTAPVYGILVGGGNATVAFNSLWMNDIAGTGDVIAIADTGAGTSVSVLSNVMQLSERTNHTVALWHGGGGFGSDYNAVNNRSGGNPLFTVGRMSTSDYASLTDWRSATGNDLHSLTGDPGFVDSLNLHVMPNSSLLDGNGLFVAAVPEDADRDPRTNPPDIGADEYLFLETPDDFAIRWLSVPSGEFHAGEAYSFDLGLTNFGWLGHTDVPVRLFFDGALMAELPVSLLPGASDTLTVTWIPPDLALTDGLLVARVCLAGDLVAANDSVSAAVTVIGPPLAGDFDVAGGAAQFPSLSAAVRHLALRGVSGPVTLNLFNPDAAGTLCLPEIPGTDSSACVVVRTATVRSLPVILSAPAGEAVLLLDGADNLTFEDLGIAAAGSCTTAVTLRGGATGNRFRNCFIQGFDSLASASTAIRVLSDGNHNNNFESLIVSRAFTGIALGGGAAAIQGLGNSIRDCAITNTRYGITVSRQTGAVVEGNDIQPGSPAPLAAACYGVFINALGPGGSVTVNANRIHGFADGSGALSNRAVGIYAAAGGDASVLACNNFIYDFAGAGTLKRNAFYLSAGHNNILHNTVRLDDVASSTEIAAIYSSTGSEHFLRNNILLCLEDTLPACGILVSGGQVESDGNLLFGPSASFSVARVGSTVYPTLAAWQGTGNDVHSVSSDPGFVSPADLHLADSASVAYRHGIETALVTTDIDGEDRGTPPDIGADEYSAPCIPPAVNDLTITAIDGTVHLAWTPVPLAACYHVYRDSSLEMSMDPLHLFGTVLGTSFSDTVTGDDMSHFFYVIIADPTPPFSPAPVVRHRPHSGEASLKK